MSEIPTDLVYTKEHEYLQSTGADVYSVGITDYAQGELGDIVYVELPEVGDSFRRMEVFGTVEAVKAVSDLYCPISGEIVEVNERLSDDPGLVNSDPYGKGWLVRIRVTDEGELEELMSPEDYSAHIGES
jgi:glycine cleavage system H protein